MRKFDTEDRQEEVNIAALIDMTFLLLVYFMAAATLHTSEADLGIRLPGPTQTTDQIICFDEQVIEVKQTGRVVLNEKEYDDAQSTDLPELVAMLIRYRLSSEASKNPPFITLCADNDARHQRVVDVLNACATAGIRNISFTPSAD